MLGPLAEGYRLQDWGEDMDDPTLALVKAVHQKEIERLRAVGDLLLLPSTEPTIFYTDLSEFPRESPIYGAWNTYRRVVGQFIADGSENVWVAIKGDSILGVYPNARLACFAFANEPPDVQNSILIKQITANERQSTLQSLRSQCPLSPIPLAKTA